MLSLNFQMPQCCVYNVYGPTEATITATALACPPSIQSISIGRPVYNLHAYVVDSALRAVPVGVPGELLLSGPRLALGYAGRPDLTEEKFVPNPCLELVSGHVDPELAPFYKLAYRTGDLVRWRADGNIDFLGRIDRQVKITGVRIELGEVEAAMERAQGVTQAVAAAVADPSGQKRLVGYVTPGDVSSTAVIQHCRSLLVPAMVPSAVVPLDAFPLLPNGKVDQRALPDPDWSGAAYEEYVGPGNGTETAVQRVFAEVLGRSVEEVSVLADFFAAGGTSLQVFRITALLQDALNIELIPVTMVHGERTARGVAGALSELLVIGDEASHAPVTARNWPDAYRPLSSNQEQMWLLSTVGKSAAYNMPTAFELLDFVPDVAGLRTALDAVARRHEVLRTRFQKGPNGSIGGMVVSADSFHVPVEVVEVHSAEEEQQQVEAEFSKPFDLETDPLLRVRLLVRTNPATGAVLILTLHHAVGDAWSMEVFSRELSEAYTSAINGASPNWSPLAIQYADYAAWQREQLACDLGTSLRAFWKQKLVGVPAMIQLPQDRARPARPTSVAGAIRTHLPPGLLPQLENLARSLRVNVQAVLLAGLQAVLFRYSGQDDIVVGVPVAGRDRQETHDLVGYFINTLPVRCLASIDATFADMVRGASLAMLEGLEHSLLPLEEMITASGVSRAPNVNPLFQVIFQYLPPGAAGANLSLDSVKANPYTGARLSNAKIDFSLLMGGENVLLEYMSELFDATTIQRLFGSFVGVLQQMVSNAEASALGGSLLNAQDAKEVAALSMGVQRPEYLTAPFMHEAFETAAASFPNNRCVGYEGKWLSYAEVDARASETASQLAALGVAPGVVVGLMLDRSFELVVTILGVFKAGGCYLPCDPSYPDDRLAIYLEDGGAKVVLVQAQHATRAQSMVAADVRVVDISTLASEAKQLSSTAIVKRPGCEDPAYMIFTSGSTGRPKGVVLPHRGLRDLLPWLVDQFQLGAKDIVMFSNTINFDAHIIQVRS